MRPTAELVIAAQSQDRAAFAELIRRYERAVIATAWSVLHDYHAAQDVAQDSFVIAFCRLGTLRDGRTFGAWMLTLTRREALRRSRRRKVMLPIDSVVEPTLSTTADTWEPGYADLAEAIGRLPEHERIVVVFHYLDGYSAAEVAEMTGRPVGTVTKQISRGLDRLRGWLGEAPK